MGGTGVAGRRVRVQLAKWSCASASGRRARPGLLGRSQRAQVAELDTSHTVFYEAPTPDEHVRLHAVGRRAGDAVVVARGARRAGRPTSSRAPASRRRPAPFTRRATAPTSSAPRACTTSATWAHGEVTLKGETTSLTAGYDYSTEHDYRSQLVHVNARTDAFQHNTQFELSYARNFDSVCDRVQTRARPARPAGCALETRPAASRRPDPHDAAIGIDTYEASWAQSWTPVVETQLTYTAQLVDGFQSDPVPQRHPRRGRQGAGARAQRARARGRDGAVACVSAAIQGPRCGSRCAATTTPGPSRAAPSRPSSRSRSASRCA